MFYTLKHKKRLDDNIKAHIIDHDNGEWFWSLR